MMLRSPLLMQSHPQPYMEHIRTWSTSVHGAHPHILTSSHGRILTWLCFPFFRWRFGEPEARDEADEVDRKAHPRGDKRHLGWREGAIGRRGEGGGDSGERRADQPPTDV